MIIGFVSEKNLPDSFNSMSDKLFFYLLFFGYYFVTGINFTLEDFVALISFSYYCSLGSVFKFFIIRFLVVLSFISGL